MTWRDVKPGETVEVNCPRCERTWEFVQPEPSESYGAAMEGLVVEMQEHLHDKHGYGDGTDELLDDFFTFTVGGEPAAPTCQRCDRPFDVRRRALSRTATETKPVHVCEGCGTEEAFEQAAGRLTPREQWPVKADRPVRHTMVGWTEPWEQQRSNRTLRRTPIPTPGEVPDLRVHLLERWADGGTWDRVFGATSPGEARAERECLRRASLWWVKDDMVDLTAAAAKAIPSDVLASELTLPGGQPFGMAVLAKPLVGIDAAGDGRADEVEVHLFTWGQGIVMGQVALTFTLYRYIDFAGGMNAQDMRMALSQGLIDQARAEKIRAAGEQMAARLRGGAWAFLGRSSWPLSCPLDGVDYLDEAMLKAIGRRDREIVEASYLEDRRWFAAFCVLTNHRLSQQETVYAPRATRRRAERAGVDAGRGISDVRLIRLREARREHPDDEPGGGAGRRHVEWSHRWMVGAATGGHTAWRRCGPGRNERRLVWIAPYVKGPADKELVIKEEVRVWVR